MKERKHGSKAKSPAGTAHADAVKQLEKGLAEKIAVLWRMESREFHDNWECSVALLIYYDPLAEDARCTPQSIHTDCITSEETWLPSLRMQFPFVVIVYLDRPSTNSLLSWGPIVLGEEDAARRLSAPTELVTPVEFVLRPWMALMLRGDLCHAGPGVDNLKTAGVRVHLNYRRIGGDAETRFPERGPTEYFHRVNNSLLFQSTVLPLDSVPRRPTECASGDDPADLLCPNIGAGCVVCGWRPHAGRAGHARNPETSSTAPPDGRRRRRRGAADS